MHETTSREIGGGGPVELADLSDSDLVARQLAGDERAFRFLTQRYQGALVNFVYRTIGDRERSEDLVQEAFLRVYRHLHRFDPTKKFSSWIYAIAGNLAKNELRNRSRRPLVLFQTLRKWPNGNGRPIEWPSTKFLPDEMARRRNLRRIVEETVAELPEAQRQVFTLRELEGKPYEEIAEIMGSKLGTVKSRLNRARNRFAELVTPKLE